MSPIEIVEQECVAHGLRLTGHAPIVFLLGFLIGRDWSEQRLADEDALRAWLQRYFAATGRRRKKEVSRVERQRERPGVSG